MRRTPAFSAETIKATRARADVLQTLRAHRHQLGKPYTEKSSITIDRENKAFHDTNKFKQHLFTNSALHKVVGRKLQPKEVNHTQENTRNK